MKRLFILAMVSLLSACATKNSYVAPNKNEVATASIISSWTRNGAFDWEGYSIESIDGKQVSYGLQDRDWVTFDITEGDHQLVVYAKFNRSFGGACPCQTFSELHFKAKAGIEYKLMGEVKGTNVFFWVINKATGEVASEKFSSSYGSSPKDVYIPMYLPG